MWSIMVSKSGHSILVSPNMSHFVYLWWFSIGFWQIFQEIQHIRKPPHSQGSHFVPHGLRDLHSHKSLFHPQNGCLYPAYTFSFKVTGFIATYKIKYKVVFIMFGREHMGIYIYTYTHTHCSSLMYIYRCPAGPGGLQYNYITSMTDQIQVHTKKEQPGEWTYIHKTVVTRECTVQLPTLRAYASYKTVLSFPSVASVIFLSQVPSF